MAGGIVAFQGEHAVAGILGIIMIALCGLFAVLALPSIIAGWGLFAGKSWARPLSLVLAILHLPNIPFGTAYQTISFSATIFWKELMHTLDC
jgi:hypothetical protein